MEQGEIDRYFSTSRASLFLRSRDISQITHWPLNLQYNFGSMHSQQ